MHLQANQWPFCLFSMDSCPSTSFANLRFSFLLSGWLLRKCSLSAALLVAPLCLLPATGQRRHFWQGWQHGASSLCHLSPSCQVVSSSCARSDIAGLTELRLALLCGPVCKRASSGAAAVARKSKNCEAAADELAVWSSPATSPCFLPAYITTRDPEDASLVHPLSDFRCKKFSICSLLPSKEREGFSHWQLL